MREPTVQIHRGYFQVKIRHLRAGDFFVFEGRDHPYIVTCAHDRQETTSYRSLKTGKVYLAYDADLGRPVLHVVPTRLEFTEVTS